MQKRIVIIYYHDVVEKGKGFSYQKIEKDKFEEQMKFLKNEGYHTILFSDLERPLPTKSVIVSFDDGFRSVYTEAYPIMKKYGIKANVYLPTKYISNDEKFMTWEMIQELQKTKMFEFAGHTYSHVDIRTLSKEDLREEIKKSNNMIKRMVGYVPKAFCMPYGVFDKRSLNIIRKMGCYSYILGSFYGTIGQNKLKNKTVPRIGISNDDSNLTFEKKIMGKLNWKGYFQRFRLFLQTKMRKYITEYEY